MAEENEAKYTIVDMSKIPSAETGRAGKYDLIVSYRDSAGRVRVVNIPYEEFEGKSEEEQEEVLRKYIRGQEEERLRFIGREVSVG